MARLARHQKFRLDRYHLDVRAGRGRLCRCAGLHGSSLARSTARQALVAVLIVIWALRLGLHIALRTAGIKDDPRYGKMAAAWGADASRQMFLLAQKQALVSIPLALSMVLAAWNPLPGLRLQDALGVLVLIVGHRRRRRRRCAVAALSRRSGQSKPCLRCRTLGLVAASELFLRMARLARLSAARDRFWRLSIRGAGRRLPVRSACIGFWCMSPAFRRSRSTCWSAAATNSAPIRHAPTPSFPRRRGPFKGAAT